MCQNYSFNTSTLHESCPQGPKIGTLIKQYMQRSGQQQTPQILEGVL
jgi:hypothetical protein